MSFYDNENFKDFTEFTIADVLDIVPDLEKSHGNYIVDALTGKEYLDCFSYIASNPIGHNHPKLNNNEFEKELLHAAKTKPSNSDFVTKEYADFISKFSKYAKPQEFKHLFFIDGGALAVENALKAAFDWKAKKNLENGSGKTDNLSILHFRQAFHGRTGYTLSLTNTADPRKTMYFPKFNWPRVLNPKLRFKLGQPDLEKQIKDDAEAIAQIDLVFNSNKDNIAAIIIEPIQGEGGDNHFSKNFHQKLREIADERGVLLIYDEVQSGLGLTGQRWAYMNYDMVPDIVCFGKKTQVCGMMSTDRIDEIEENVFTQSSRINSTWGGSLADMVRVGRYLEIIEEDELVSNAKDVGSYLLEGLVSIEKDHSSFYTNARAEGLMAAIDVPNKDIRSKLVSDMKQAGVLVLVCGEQSVRFRPSLNFSKQEVDKLIDALVTCVNTKVS